MEIKIETANTYWLIGAREIVCRFRFFVLATTRNKMFLGGLKLCADETLINTCVSSNVEQGLRPGDPFGSPAAICRLRHDHCLLRSAVTTDLHFFIFFFISLSCTETVGEFVCNLREFAKRDFFWTPAKESLTVVYVRHAAIGSHFFLAAGLI